MSDLREVKRPVRVDGGEGELVSFDGKLLVCRLDRAFAPGSPIRIQAYDHRGGFVIEGRSLGSRRFVEEPGYEVRLRLVNFNRDRRDRLAAFLRSS